MIAQIPFQPQTRIALLIDADNVQPESLDYVIKTLESRGKLTIRRAFGNWANPHLSSWASALRTYAVEAEQSFNVSNGKNATDIRLVIKAIDILFSDEIDAFALVTSDSDFTPLCIRLRNGGKEVYGFGKKNTPRSLIQSFNEFDVLETPQKVAHHQPSSGSVEPDSPLLEAIKSAINEFKDPEGWAPLGRVGYRLHNPSPSDMSPPKYSSLKTFIKKTASLEYAEIGDKLIPKVRQK